MPEVYVLPGGALEHVCDAVASPLDLQPDVKTRLARTVAHNVRAP
jgi:hypothetical protein